MLLNTRTLMIRLECGQCDAQKDYVQTPQNEARARRVAMRHQIATGHPVAILTNRAL